MLPPRVTSYLDFPTTNTASQPAPDVETDSAGHPPTTSLDIRVDWNLLASVSPPANIIKVGGDSGSRKEWAVVHQNSSGVAGFTFNNGANSTFTDNGFIEYGVRQQLRATWAGTTVNWYKRNPAQFPADLTNLDDWTLSKTDPSFSDISSYALKTDTPLTIQRRDSGSGSAAFYLYQVVYVLDSVTRAHINVDNMSIDFTGKTFSDEILGAAKWSWTGTNPTFVNPNLAMRLRNTTVAAAQQSHVNYQ